MKLTRGIRTFCITATATDDNREPSRKASASLFGSLFHFTLHSSFLRLSLSSLLQRQARMSRSNKGHCNMLAHHSKLKKNTHTHTQPKYAIPFEPLFCHSGE